MPITTSIIKSNGTIMPATYDLLSIDVSKEFNKVPMAELKLADGNVAKGEFEILDDTFFEPGKEIEINLKWEGRPQDGETVFSGIVVNQGIELNQLGTLLTVELNDLAVKMTTTRKNGLFVNKTDDEIIRELLGKSKLKVGKIAPTKLPHAEMVQYYASDWDFILSRTEANGHLLLVDDGTVSTVEPVLAAPALSLELGRDDIYDFDLQVNGRGQLEKVESLGWDIAKQKLTKPAKGKDLVLKQGNLKTKDVAKAVGGEEATLLHPVAVHPEELKAWASAQVVKSRLSMLKGWIRIPGDPRLKVGETIEIKGVGERLSGKNIITGVRQEVNSHSWVTHLQIGMNADWLADQPNVVDRKAAGLIPGINGLQVGVVMPHEDDPDKEFRVRVHIPAFNHQKGNVWARLISGDAGLNRGIFFRPEAGDEVIVGFLNDDPRQAIILGAVHSSANQPPISPSAENSQKGIVTKAGYSLLFDEEKETITLSTSEKHTLCIDEKQKQIFLEDVSGNRIEMSQDGILIKSAKDITLASEGDFEIKATGNVKIGGQKVDLI